MLNKITVPNENVSDDTLIVLALLKKDGDSVEVGERIIELEGSKSVVEVVSEFSGKFHSFCRVGEQVPVGSLVAVLYDVIDELDEIYSEKLTSPKTGENNDLVEDDSSIRPETFFTNRSLAILSKHKLPLESFSGTRFVDEFSIKRAIQGIPNIARPFVVRNNSIVIVGGGGHAKMLIDILRSNNEYHLLGILDPDKPVGSEVLGVPVLGSDQLLKGLRARGLRFLANGVGAAGNHEIRRRIRQKLDSFGLYFPNIVHRTAVIESSARIGFGNQIMAGAIIGSDVTLGDHCIVNSGAIVSHDSRIASDVHLAPGSCLAGGVSVGENTLIGMKVTVYFGVSIGSNVQVTNGVDIYRNVIDGEKVLAGHS